MVEYSSEVLALKDRVKKGNNVLWFAWRQIRDIKDPEEKEALFKEWDKKVNFLNALCLELQVKGYNDCLYIDENGKKKVKCLYNPDSPQWFCNACPAAERKYCEKEFFELPDTPPAGIS